MKALVVGAAGFVGKYLVRHLQNDCGWDVVATKLSAESEQGLEGALIQDMDLLCTDYVEAVLRQHRPDVIFHLAAQSSVALSWKDPLLTIDVNLKGTVNLLESVRKSGDAPQILLIGSSEEYGNLASVAMPVREAAETHPGNIYAATKVCQNLFGHIYVQAYGMNIRMVRAFNHIGPGQSPQFVVADFCRQIAQIESGRLEPIMKVGNLEAKRDFTDVRDVVRAYALLVQHGACGETYNVGQGSAVAISDILRILLTKAQREITVIVDPNKFRPLDVPMVEADISKLRKTTGWKPSICLEKTLEDTLCYWRKRIE